MNRNLTKSHQQEQGPWSLIRNEMWDLFERFSNELDIPMTKGKDFSPKIEVKDQDNSFQVCAEVPGMSEKDINLSVSDHQLIIEGEKKNEFKKEDKKKGYFHSEISYGHFYRAIPLPEEVNEEEVSANYKDGVLWVEFAKTTEKNQRSRSIEIKSEKPSSSQQRH